MKLAHGMITFYITDVCNLNCHDCMSFSNYALKGHQLWKDNEETCRQWSEKIDPAEIHILGGEPMTNPDFLKWMHGIANFFSTSEIRINTNGTVFHLWPTLYEELLLYNGRVNISISGHNPNTKEKQINYVKNFLKEPIKEIVSGEKLFRFYLWKKVYSKIKDTSWPEVNSIEEYHNLPNEIKTEIEEIYQININDFSNYPEPTNEYSVFIDKNNIRMAWARWDEFTANSVKFDPERQIMTLHQSDPKKAIDVCHGGTCSYIKNGKWFKCHLVGNIPDLIDQKFPLVISEEDKNLIYSYEPATLDWDRERLKKFTHDLNTKATIPQCKFCPESPTFTKLFATSKKIKVKRIS